MSNNVRALMLIAGGFPVSATLTINLEPNASLFQIIIHSLCTLMLFAALAPWKSKDPTP